MSHIDLSRDNIFTFVKEQEILNLSEKVKELSKSLAKRTCEGSELLGWLSPSSYPDKNSLGKIKNIAEKIMETSDALIVIGIGGSYLGAKAGIEFLDKKNKMKIYFTGHNFSSDHLSEIIKKIKDKKVSLNVVSKSGETLETTVAFRILKKEMEEKYGIEEARKRIYITTGEKNSPLKDLAEKESYETLTIPTDIGGRYSALTAAGLLPMAVKGADIDKLVKGAIKGENIYGNSELSENPAYLYAATRHSLYRKGKVIEMLSFCHPGLHYVSEWWKQLTGESEGKNLHGIFPASMELTSDLHSLGQWMQQGERNIFETFLVVEKSKTNLKVPSSEDMDPSLDFLKNTSLDEINEKAYKATAFAHKEGGVPNMTIKIKNIREETLGELFYFFEEAVAMSALLFKVNPFNQPGVETYKEKMVSLLKNPDK